MKPARVRVVTVDLGAATGWDTVTLLGVLTARLLGAEHVLVPGAGLGSWRSQAASLLPRRRGADVTLVIAPQPVHLYAVLDRAHVWPGSELTAGWVIDAFWTDRIPAVARGGRHLDHLFVTDEEVVAEWQRVTGVPTTWVPFGADVLGRGRPGLADRGVDLQRIGRQPEGWEDDAANERRCAAYGLTYAGRPAFVPDPDANQRSVESAMAAAKYTLSFSNLASPADYTHPTRAYLTGRWTDALAQGAVVAGIPPHCAATDRLLWPEATLILPSVDPDEGVPVIAAAAAAWTPDLARHNHAQALARLDWRWRIAELAGSLGLSSPVLDAELEELSERVRRAD
ncbi:MAG: hypothetical protein IPL94_03940 [Tetrasphaera sp.]|nr:hypothetical protein [Tetrasphaera sp.]